MDWYTPEILKQEWSMYAATPSASPADRQRAKHMQDLILLGQVRNILMTLQHFGKPLPFIRQALATIKELGLLNCNAANTEGLKCSQLSNTTSPGELARVLAGYMSIDPASSEGIIEMLLHGWTEPIREGTLLGLFGARGEALALGEGALLPWEQVLAVVENFTPLTVGFPFTRYAMPQEYELLRQDTYTANSYRKEGEETIHEGQRLRTRLYLRRGNARLMATNLGHRDNVFVVKVVE